MISVTYAELSGWLAAILWPLARIAALVATAPVFGNAGVPRRVKILFALALTYVLAPLAGPLPGIDPWSAEGLVVLAQQLAVGMAMGLAMRLVFAMVDVAGEIAGLQMGLGFATFYDPQHGTHSPVIAQFLGLLTTLIFLALNGHLMLLSVLAESFQLLPVGARTAGGPPWFALADWGSKVFVSGLMLALPLITALLVTNVAIGILTRAAPQLNLFAVGFPITILVGWIVLSLSIPLLEPLLTRAFDEGLQRMLQPLPPLAPR